MTQSIARKIKSLREAEETLLGAIILDNNILEEVEEPINELNFIYEQHRMIFRAMRFMRQDGVSITVDTLRQQMKGIFPIESDYWLGSYYRKLVKAAQPATLARKCISQMKKTVEMDSGKRKSNSRSPRFLWETSYIENEIRAIEELYGKDDFGQVSSIREIKQLFIPGSFTVLLEETQGLGLILALNLVRDYVLNSDQVCAVLSKDSQQFVTELFGLVSGLGIRKLRQSNIRDEEWGLLTKAISEISDIQLFLGDLADDPKGLEDAINQFISRCEIECANAIDAPIFILGRSIWFESSELRKIVFQILRKFADNSEHPIVLLLNAKVESGKLSEDPMIDRVINLGLVRESEGDWMEVVGMGHEGINKSKFKVDLDLKLLVQP